MPVTAYPMRALAGGHTAREWPAWLATIDRRRAGKARAENIARQPEPQAINRCHQPHHKEIPC